MPPKFATPGIAAAIVIAAAGCQSSPEQTQSTGQAPSSQSSSASAATEKGGSLRIIESGLGQADQYVWATSILDTSGTKAGDFVVVNFNVKGPDGKILKSGSHTEQVAHPGDKFALGTQIDMPAATKATSVEATAAVSNNMPPGDTPKITTGDVEVAKDEYGTTYSATFEAKNSSSAPATGTRFTVVCRDSTGRINGGGVAYPDLIPGNGSTKVNVTNIITTGAPKTCSTYYLGKL